MTALPVPRAVFVTMLALATSACIGSRADTPEPVAPTVQDPLGTITIGPGAPIKIATALNGSPGPESSTGQDADRGAHLAVDFLDGELDGQPGRLLGHPVELVDVRGACEPGGAIPLPDAMTDAFVGVIGPGCPRAMTREPMTGLSGAGVVMISPSATEASLTGVADPNRTFFRTAYNDRLEGSVVADFGLDELGIDRAAIATDRESASGAAASFRSRFEESGGVVALSGLLSGGAEEVGRLLRAIALGRPELVYLVAQGPLCAQAADQASVVPGLEGVPIVASVGCFAPALSSLPVSSSANLLVAGPDLNRFQEDDFYRSEFLSAYRDQYGTAPVGAFHTNAFDATLILLDAIDRIASQPEQGTLTIGRTSLRDEVENTGGFTGLSGTISCSETGDCMPEAAIAIYRLAEMPLEGGPPEPEPVFAETVSLADLEP